MKLIYAIINFLILAAGLYLVGRKPVARIFRERREKIRTGLRAAEEGRIAAQTADADLIQLREQGRREAEQAEKEAGTGLGDVHGEIDRDAAADEATMNRELEQELKGMRLDMLRQAEADAVAAVSGAARTAFTAEPFVSEFRQHEEKIARKILELMRVTPGDRVYMKQKGVLYVTLTSAFPLESTLVELVGDGVEKMVEAEGSKISFWVKVDPALIGGLKLRIGDTVYDGTIDNILWGLASRLRREPLSADMGQAELLENILGGIRAMSRWIDIYQQGRAITVSDGICWMDGLSDSMYGELVEFDCGERGMILSVEPTRIACVVFGAYERIQELSKVRRLGWMADVPVGETLLGRVVDPLGKPLDGKGGIQAKEYRPVESAAPAILERKGVSVPLHTGIKAVDALIPIGRGQRELIIGDRQTGKTALAVDTILNQKGKNVICIYVAVGQKETSVAGVMNVLRKNGAMDYTIIVCADAFQSAPMRYIAPYAGTAMGEYFMKQGRDVLIVYDDLSKHAIAYREMSLLLHRPSGREAYPGDVFYLHSRLLERSARLSDEAGGGSMTALPIVETQAGDISAYIPTNVISITDGQIFLESDLFREGQRPAVNVGLSVSRVGGAAQIGAMRQVAGRLRMDLAQYRELAAFSQFGADLDQSTKDTLARGERMTMALRQPQYEPLPIEDQVLVIFAVGHGFTDDLAPEKVNAFERELRDYVRLSHPELLREIASGGKMSAELISSLENAIREYKRSGA